MVDHEPSGNAGVIAERQPQNSVVNCCSSSGFEGKLPVKPKSNGRAAAEWHVRPSVSRSSTYTDAITESIADKISDKTCAVR
jgi:hypothetical protein